MSARYKWVLDKKAKGGSFVEHDRETNSYYYVGDSPPTFLEPLVVSPLSYLGMIENILNGGRRRPRRPGDPHDFGPAVLRERQKPAIEALDKAVNAGSPGFLYADPTGSGKMVVSTSFARDDERFNKVLVVAPVNAIRSVPGWESTVSHLVGTGGKFWTIVNYESLWRLFDPTEPMKEGFVADQLRATVIQESPMWMSYDLVILDESHRAANQDTLTATAINRITEQSNAFMLHTTATPIAVTKDARYLAPILGWKVGLARGKSLVGEPESLESWFNRIAAIRGMEGITRAGDFIPITSVGNDTILRDSLFKPSDNRPAVGIARTKEEMGLPPQVRRLRPVRLSASQMATYEQTWVEFCNVYRDHKNGVVVRDPETIATLALRAIQKASWLRIDKTAKRVHELVQQGKSVIVASWFLENMSALHERLNQLAGGDYLVVGVDGQHTQAERQQRLMAFNDGFASNLEGDRVPVNVVITNVLEAVSLHQGAGKSQRPRYTVMADVLLGGRRSIQAEGRGQRDGKESPAEYHYSVGTVEERLLSRSLSKSATTRRTLGDDAEAMQYQEFADSLDADIPIPGIDRVADTKKQQDVLFDNVVNLAYRANKALGAESR